ncbi:hypothetical protein ACLKA7_008519 [Drosophila subpalustris]
MEIVGLWVGSVGDSFSPACPTPVESASGCSEKPLRNSRNSRQSSPQSQPPRVLCMLKLLIRPVDALRKNMKQTRVKKKQHLKITSHSFMNYGKTVCISQNKSSK